MQISTCTDLPLPPPHTHTHCTVFADDFTVLGLRERFRQAAHTLLTP